MGRGESRGEYMDEIYTIWQGEYSDADVIGVAYDKEIADAYAKLKGGYVKTVPIITDRNFITRANNMIICHKYRFEDLDLDFIREDTIEPTEELKDVEPCWSFVDVYVYGETDKTKSRKIAQDKVMKYLAEKMENDMLEGNNEV